MNVRNPHAWSENCSTCTTRHLSVFCSLSNENVSVMENKKSCNTYRKGQAIFHENGHPLGIYCIHSGKVKVAQSGSDGKDQIVRLSKSGDIVGYRALLAGERYNASAIALEETKACFIPKQVFLNILQTNCSLSSEIIRMLASELRKAEETITGIAQKPVRERMAEALLFLKQTYGCESDEATLNVILSREEIANLVGTATETAIRLLSELKQGGVVSFIGKKIKINDLPRLVRYANVYN